MKNKGRRHKSGDGPYANGNCKGELCGITRPIRQMGTRTNKPIRMDGTLIRHSKIGKFGKKKWHKRVRGYFKSQTKKSFI